MVTIDILGSCVTRDAFAFITNDLKLNSYYPRSSLISIYAPPLNIKKDGIEIKSEYQQRLIYWDLNKEFFKHIKKSEAEVLIIDFMDERLGVLKFQNTYITNSDELNLSNIKKIFKTEKLDFNEEYMELWEISALKFIHDIRKRPYKNVILHKAFYMDNYIDEAGEKHLYTDPTVLNRIDSRNSMLNRMYKFIENNISNVEIIEPPGFAADKSHKWGFLPFHYEYKYYKYFMDSLNSLINK